ncbi:MAG: hypothetical protein EOM87_04845 [Clostridia bacterium]|nr:hypothetical protein [Clostridia bacterium]
MRLILMLSYFAEKCSEDCMNRIYNRLKLSEINIGGLLKKQLVIQLKGLTGNISKIWYDLSDENAWLGGKGEAWERGPYYLSGLIPIAYLLEDEWAKDEVKKWVDSIVASQDAQGNFGPSWNVDWWPRMVVLKALVPYVKVTGDIRIVPFMEKYFKYQYDNIDRQPLKFWAAARAFEAMEAIRFVHRYTKSQFLVELVKKLKMYSLDYFSLFDNYTYQKPMTKYFNKFIFNLGKTLLEPFDEIRKKRTVKPAPESRDSILAFNQRKAVRTIMLTHGVNLAHAIKYPITYGAFLGNDYDYSLSKKGLDSIRKYHGNATGLYSSDEHIMGTSPAQGVELCTVVESMYSLEEIGMFVKESWAYELLEFLAYNTLPATFSPDMCAHQYVQQPNQVAADARQRQFFDTDKYGNTFGLEPNYGCCAANMHSGFPKFAEYLALSHPTGLAFMVYGEAEFCTRHNGGDLIISERTDYPFGEEINFEVKKAVGDVELHFRKIQNTQFVLTHNGEKVDGDDFYKINAKQGDSVKITAKPELNIADNPDGSVSIKYGNILLATKLTAEEQYIKGKMPFEDRSYTTNDEWRIAPLIKDNGLSVIATTVNETSDLPFEIPPFEITVEGVLVKNWELSKNSANIPEAPYELEEKPLTLVPYGCTRLRIAQYPKILK